MSPKAPLSVSISQAFLNSYTQSGGVPQLLLLPILCIECISSPVFLSHLQILALLFLFIIYIYHLFRCVPVTLNKLNIFFPYMTHNNFLICFAFSALINSHIFWKSLSWSSVFYMALTTKSRIKLCMSHTVFTKYANCFSCSPLWNIPVFV